MKIGKGSRTFGLIVYGVVGLSSVLMGSELWQAYLAAGVAGLFGMFMMCSIEE